MELRTARKAHGASRTWVRLLVLAAVALLVASMVQSCQPVEPDYYAHGPCALCNGTGLFGDHSCPNCRGLGYIRVRYSYPVIEPVK